MIALRRLAALLLALQAWAACVPAGHAAIEALQGKRSPASRGAAVDASCNPGCGHSHHAHDPATCTTCRSVSGLVATPVAPVLALGVPALSRVRHDDAPVALLRAAGRACTRGPPSLLG